MNKAMGIGLLAVILGVVLVVAYYLTSKPVQSMIPAPSTSHTQQGKAQESMALISITVFPAGTTLKSNVPATAVVSTSNAVVTKTASLSEAPPTAYTKTNSSGEEIQAIPIFTLTSTAAKVAVTRS